MREWDGRRLNTGRWYLVPARPEYLHSLPLRMYSFLPFDLCAVDRYKTTTPWKFLQREPSVSICFRVISWQWCLPVNSSHKFKEGREKKPDLARFIGLHILQQFWNLLAYQNSLWSPSLYCDLSHLGKWIPCYWWHKCSGTVKPKCKLNFFGFWQSLLPWGGQLNF